MGEGLPLLVARDEIEAEAAGGLANIKAEQYESFQSADEMLARLVSDFATEVFDATSARARGIGGKKVAPGLESCVRRGSHRGVRKVEQIPNPVFYRAAR
jgi:hypothetical protein